MKRFFKLNKKLFVSAMKFLLKATLCNCIESFEAKQGNMAYDVATPMLLLAPCLSQADYFPNEHRMNI